MQWIFEWVWQGKVKISEGCGHTRMGVATQMRSDSLVWSRIHKKLSNKELPLMFTNLPSYYDSMYIYSNLPYIYCS